MKQLLQKKLSIFSILFTLFSLNASAGFYLDPYIGLERSAVSMTTSVAMSGIPAGTNITLLSATGVTVGSRVGLKLLLPIWFALDGSMSNGKYTWDIPGFTKDSTSVKKTSLFATVGFDFPILLRGWVGYGLMNEMQTDDTTFSGGSLMKAGIGLGMLPLISLNLEFITSKPGKVKDSTGTSVDSTAAFSKLEEGSLLLSASFPLNL